MRSIFSKPLFIAIASLPATSVFAETAIDPIVVTASRHEQSLDDTLSSTTLITRKDIEESNASSLEDLLMSVSGFDVIQSGPYGKNTSIFMRGTNSTHTLTLIDGIRIHSATTGSTAFQHLPLSQIDRIEIVRGPVSSLYGSEAIGGVIQIFTRKGSKKSTAKFNIEEGSNNTSKVEAGFSGQKEKIGYSLYASHFSTDGIDAIKHTTANDNDGYDKKSLTTNLSYKFNKVAALDFKLLNAEGTTLYDNCYNSSFSQSDNCYADFEQQAISTKLKLTPKGIWDAVVLLGSSKDFSDNFWEDTTNNTYQTEVSNISLQNNFQISKNNLVIAGIDYVEDTVLATPYTVYDKTRDNQGTFVSWKSKAGATSFKTSVRNDDNEQFGSHVTGTLSAGYKVNKSLKTFITFGTAFKAPTFNQLYWPGYSNPNLLPEESESIEIGLKKKFKKSILQLSVYNTKIDNLIVSATNINKAEIDGIEASTSMKLTDWKVKFSTNFIEPINKDATNYGKILKNRAQYNISMNAVRYYGKTGVFVSVLNQGKRYTDSANTTALDAYTVVDLKLNRKINKNITTDIKIKNIFDEEYLLNGGFNTYNTLGRSVFVSLTYKM